MLVDELFQDLETLSRDGGTVADGVAPDLVTLAHDPQTSGGLLAAIPELGEWDDPEDLSQPGVPEVAALAVNTSRHVITYGFAADADVRAEDVGQDGGCMRFTLCLPDATRTPIELALPGRHNVQNALAAATVGWQLGIAPDTIAQALQKFAGIGRRFNLLAQLRTAKGATVQLVDDYGHHPKELEAVFAAARGGWPDKRLVVAFQPHRYSRTRDLFDDFAGVLSSVDALVLTEVYPAGEAPIVGADARSLARAIRARGRIDPVVVNSAADLASVLPDVLHDGDLLLLMGAGDIGHAAQQLAAHGFHGAGT